MHQSCIKGSIISKWTKPSFHLSLSPRSPIECVPKRFLCQWYVQCKPCTYLCTDTSIVSKWTKMRFHMTHVTYEFHRVSPKLFIRIWFIRWNPCTYLVLGLALSPNGLNRAPPDPRLPGVPSGASKTIYEPMLRLTQTEHLSCTDANTISKQIKTRLHMTHVT
jgi:hypothetical protein